MKPLTEKLFSTYSRIDGMRVTAFVTTAALGNSQVQKTPYRMMVVRNPCLVKLGDVMNAENDEKILLMEHPSDNAWSTNFKAAYVRIAFPWTRPTQIKDPVTGFPRDQTVWQNMGPIYANFDTPIEETTLGMTETEYRFLTGQDVHVRDKVGPKIVTKVTQVLGVNLVYAS